MATLPIKDWKKLLKLTEVNDFTKLLEKEYYNSRPDKPAIWQYWLDDKNIKTYKLESESVTIIGMNYYTAFLLYNIGLLKDMVDRPCMEDYIKFNFEQELDTLEDKLYSLNNDSYCNDMIIWVWRFGHFELCRYCKHPKIINEIKNAGV